MNEIWQAAAMLLLFAALAAWQHSKLVSLACWIPFLVTELALRGVIDVSAPEHPLRVVVPVIGMLLGTAEVVREARQNRRTSRATILGGIAFVSGLADIAALPVFKVLEEWVCPPIQVFFCLVTIAIGVWPKGRWVPWVSSTFSAW
jgi:hypothetical protein